MYSNLTSLWTRFAENLAGKTRRIAAECLSALSPGKVVSNPVRLALLLCAVASTVSLILASKHLTGFNVALTVLIWLILFETVVSHALLRIHSGVSTDVITREAGSPLARKLVNGVEYPVPVTSLRNGDLVLCESNEMIPADGVVVQGTAIVDESAITGESPPVLRESGEEGSEVAGKTTVLGGRIVVRVTAKKGRVVLDKAASVVERIDYRMSSDERRMAIPIWLLVGGFAVAYLAIPFLAGNRVIPAGDMINGLIKIPAFISVFACTLPLTSSELLNTAAVSAVCRLVSGKIIPSSINAVETAALVDVLMLDEKEAVAFNRQTAKGSVLTGETAPDDDCFENGDQGAASSFPSGKMHDLGLRTILSADSHRASELSERIGAVSCFSGCGPNGMLTRIQSEQSSGRVVAVVGNSEEVAPVARDANLCFMVDGGADMPEGGPNAIGLNGRPSRLINAIETGRLLSLAEKRLTYFAVGVTISMTLLALFPLLATLFGAREVVETMPRVNFLGLTSSHSTVMDMSIFTVIAFPSISAFIARSMNAPGIRTGRFAKVSSGSLFILGIVVPLVMMKLIDAILVALRFV